ncbi:CHD1 helical C-terminal domain containing protein 1 [Rhea pennata]|uniref:CHD1 helical C-terminal domain containing protein 1 n=1 Tax=Rhea pennata TaxID=8795 RepID=UPI002E26520C
MEEGPEAREETMGLEEEEDKATVGMGEPLVWSGAGQTTERDLLGTASKTTYSKGSLSAPPDRTQLICCTDDLDEDTFKICKEFLRPFKKSLRKLYLPQHITKVKKLKYTKESLTLLGDHINMFLQQHCKPSEVKHWKKMLWRYVSLFSEMDARQLHRLYKYAKNNQMDKFLRLYCHSENPDSAPVPEEKLRKLYDVWGLHRGANDAQGHPAQGDSRHKRSCKAVPSSRTDA